MPAEVLHVRSLLCSQLAGEEPRCQRTFGNMLAPSLIEKWASDRPQVSGTYFLFLLCYTVGLIYFFIMYMPRGNHPHSIAIGPHPFTAP